MIRTGISGVLASVIDLAALIVLVEIFGVQVAMAAFVSAGLGAAANFAISKFWAFGDRSPVDPRQLFTFGAVALCSAALVAIGVQVLAVGLGAPYLVAKAIAAIAVFACWSFPAQSRWVFRGAGRPVAARVGRPVVARVGAPPRRPGRANLQTHTGSYSSPNLRTTSPRRDRVATSLPPRRDPAHSAEFRPDRRAYVHHSERRLERHHPRVQRGAARRTDSGVHRRVSALLGAAPRDPRRR